VAFAPLSVVLKLVYNSRMRLLLFLALLLSLDACQSPSRFQGSAQPVGRVNTEAARVPT
jgi:hypothetical protein